MSILKITEWVKETDESFGWKSIDDLEYIIEHPGSIPPKFFDEDTITAYVIALSQVLASSSQHAGVLGYKAFLDASGSLLTVVEIDTLQHLDDLDDANNADPYFTGTFVPARTALLGLFEVDMVIHDPVEADIDLEDSTFEEIHALIE